MSIPRDLIHIHHLWWPRKVRDLGGPEDQRAALAEALEKAYWREKALEKRVEELESNKSTEITDANATREGHEGSS